MAFLRPSPLWLKVKLAIKVELRATPPLLYRKNLFISMIPLFLPK